MRFCVYHDDSFKEERPSCAFECKYVKCLYSVGDIRIKGEEIYISRGNDEQRVVCPDFKPLG